MLNAEDIGEKFAKVDVYDAPTELGYMAKRSGLTFVARRTADIATALFEGAAEMISGALTSTVGGTLELVVGQEIARDVGAFAGAFGNKLIGLLGMGLAAGVSASFAQMDYQHQKTNIKNYYKDEIGAHLHKSPDAVTVADLEAVAKDVPVLQKELDRARKQRNFNVPLAVATTLISFAVVTNVLPVVVSLASMSTFAAIALKATVSMLTYFAAKTPLQMLGSNLFGLHEETPNDRIYQLKRAHKRGIEVTPEQVMAVFTKTNPNLEDIITREFGKPYDQLSHEQQNLAVEKLKQAVPAEKLAHDINTSEIKPAELVFAASGQSSGISRKEPKILAPEPRHPCAEKTVSFAEKYASRAQTHVKQLEQAEASIPINAIARP